MKVLSTIKEIDRKTDYDKLFQYAAILFHAIGLFLLCAYFYAYTSLSGIDHTWAKLGVFPMYVFIAVFGADGIRNKKLMRFVWATLTNYIIIFTF